MRERGDNRRAPIALQSPGGGTSASTPPKGWHQQEGNLQFTANFESGNIGEVTQLNECEYDIKIRPDTNNNRHRLWFYFSVSNVRPQQQVLLNIVNFSKTKSLYREGLAPVVCSRRRPQWNVLYYRSPKGSGNRMAYIMSFLFQFDGTSDAPYYFAYAFPYTYTDLQRYLYSLERQDLPFLRREALCRTLQQRRVELLTITAPEDEPGSWPLQDRKWVFMSARVHPGETPSQFIIHGVIDFLTGNSPRARALRANVVFKIVPMLNPDGVVNGNYRCSYLGFDLNRHWLEPSTWGQPEIMSVKTLVTALHEDPGVDLDFYVDIHAHSVGTNSFMYGNNIPARRKEPAPQPPGASISQPEAGKNTTSTGAQPSSPQRCSVAENTDPSPHAPPILTSTPTVPSRPTPSAPSTPVQMTATAGRAKDGGRQPATVQAPRKGGAGGHGGGGRRKSGDAGEGDRGSGSSRASESSIGGGVKEVAQAIDDDEDSDVIGGALAAFPRLLAVNAPDFSFARSRFDADLSKEGTGRRALGQLLSPDVLCFTLEVSFYASRRDDVGLIPYTRVGYVDLGRSLASTFFDYYGLAGVVHSTGGQ